LWHQKLSHASLDSIHNLCRQKRTPKVTTKDDLVPLLTDKLLPCTYKMPSDVCENLLCCTCAAAKAHRKTPGIRQENSTKQHDTISPPELQPGDCISCDHYSSPEKGRVVSDSGHSSTWYGYEGVVYSLITPQATCSIELRSL
jgi:hypothetical protein